MPSRSAQPIQFMSLVTIIGAIAASVLLVLPFTDSFITHTKTYLLFATGLLVTILFLVRVLKRNSFDIVLSPLTAPLTLLGVITLLSSFLTNQYPVENLLGMGGIYIAVVLVALLGSSLLPKHSSQTYLSALGVIGSILIVLTGLQFVGLGPVQWLNALFGLNIPSGLIFNLSGSSLVGMQVALVGLVGAATYFLINRKLPTILMVTTPILVIAVGVFGYSLMPGQPTAVVLPSFTASWSVALDAVRVPKSAIIGVGPASYTNVYSQFKPAWVNMQDYWNITFSQGANVPLTILTTLGFLGLAAWILIVVAAIKMLRTVNKENLPLAWMIVAMMALQLVLPANVVMLTILAITMAVLGAAERHKLPLLQLQALSMKVTNQLKSDQAVVQDAKKTRVVTPFNVIAAILLVGVLFLTYFVGRSYAAYFYMNEANKAAIQDNVTQTYELHRKAVQLNPYLDVFRRRYAFTNMLIAAALSNKTDANEQDSEQISQLLQQAVREARAATLLDGADSQNWLTLAQIYEQMIGVTDEAEQWATQSYVTAIETNPMDPNIRISLGGIFLSQQNYEQAASVFDSAIKIKADHPNSYFNFGVALEQLGNLKGAKSAYQQVLALINPDTEDYTLVTQQLEQLEAKITEASASAQTTEEEPGIQKEVKPSLLEQNLQSQEELINNPSNLDLNTGAEEPAQPAEIDEAEEINEDLEAPVETAPTTNNAETTQP